MSRGLSSAMLTEANGPTFRAAYFVQLDWPGGTVRAWTGYGDISWGGNTWIGTGHIGSVGDISENTDLSANTLALKISGVPSAEIALALDPAAQGRDGFVYVGALNAAGALVSDPKIIYSGFINFPIVEDDGTTATITLNLAKELSRRNAQPRRYTHEDQQIDHPGDNFFADLAGNLGQEFAWGRQVIPAAGNTSGSGTDGTESTD